MGLITNINVVEKWIPTKENGFDFIHDVIPQSQTQWLIFGLYIIS